MVLGKEHLQWWFLYSFYEFPEYLLDFMVMSIKSVKDPLDAISAYFCPFEACVCVRIQKFWNSSNGLLKAFSPVKYPGLSWDLNLVLMCLIWEVALWHAGSVLIAPSLIRTAFLVAIMLIIRQCDIQAHKADPPYITFYLDKIPLRTHCKFLPKLVTEYCLQQ